MTEPPSVTWHGHATVGVELDGQYFLTDPALTPRLAHLRRHHPVDLAQLGHPDVVLISHLHLDHLHPASLRLLADRLTDGATIVVPSGASGEVEGLTGADVLETRVGDELRFGATTVRTVPAAHSDSRGPHRRVRADAVGYVMSGPSGSVYFPGDDGCRGVFAMVGPKPVSVQRGAFGGGALGAREQHPIDSDQTVRELPAGCVAVNGQEGAFIYLTLTARDLRDLVD